MGLCCFKQTLLALTQIADHQDSHLPSELIFVQLVARLYCFVSLLCPWCVQDLAFTFFSTLSSYCHIISSVKVPLSHPFFFSQQPSHLDSYHVVSSAKLQRKHSTLLAIFFFFTLLRDLNAFLNSLPFLWSNFHCTTSQFLLCSLRWLSITVKAAITGPGKTFN